MFIERPTSSQLLCLVQSYSQDSLRGSVQQSSKLGGGCVHELGPFQRHRPENRNRPGYATAATGASIRADPRMKTALCDLSSFHRPAVRSCSDLSMPFDFSRLFNKVSRPRTGSAAELATPSDGLTGLESRQAMVPTLAPKAVARKAVVSSRRRPAETSCT